jgi:hypothetical protein
VIQNVRNVAVAALAGLVASLGMVTLAPSLVSAAVIAKPVVVYFNNEGWKSVLGFPAAMVRPTAIYTGQGGSYVVSELTWSHWTTSAHATGTISYPASATCVPIASCPEVSLPVGVTLEDVATHDDVRYFAIMEYSWTSTGRHHAVWFVMHSNGFFQELS